MTTSTSPRTLSQVPADSATAITTADTQVTAFPYEQLARNTAEFMTAVAASLQPAAPAPAPAAP